jgi:hypothetical protein
MELDGTVLTQVVPVQTDVFEVEGLKACGMGILLDFATLPKGSQGEVETFPFAPAATNCSLVVDNANPAVNQEVTFTATLTPFGGTPIPKLVTIYHYLNGVRYDDDTWYSTLTYPKQFASPGIYTCYASFAGDSSYQASTSSAVTITVNKVATKTVVWAPPVWNPDTIVQPGPSNPISPGWYCRAVVDAADGTHPCGLANWYIDNATAGGVWSYNAPGVNGLPGCSAGMGGGFAKLQLNASDIANLSPGYHTLKCDYLGDSTYAASEWVGTIYVA